MVETKLTLKQLAHQRKMEFLAFASKQTYKPRKQRLRKGGK